MKNMSFRVGFALSGFFAKRLRPVTRLREQEISFFQLFIYFFFFSCQAVTAVKKGQGGMDSAVSVAH